MRTLGAPTADVTAAWTSEPFSPTYSDSGPVTVDIDVSALSSGGVVTAALEWTTDHAWPPSGWQTGQSVDITATGTTSVAFRMPVEPITPDRYLRLTLTPVAGASATVAGITVTP